MYRVIVTIMMGITLIGSVYGMTADDVSRIDVYTLDPNDKNSEEIIIVGDSVVKWNHMTFNVVDYWEENGSINYNLSRKKARKKDFFPSKKKIFNEDSWYQLWIDEYGDVDGHYMIWLIHTTETADKVVLKHEAWNQW